ncbi:glycosyltransferase [Candidatus Methylomirabilis sp.]|uniref:glycosyltransferase n=1 Tax=Candidatus Methylomirabilis sp. TaxID=2032687 RepID=UPI003076063F
MTVSVILPVMNETWSLEKTTRILVAENQTHLEEILVVTSPRTSENSLHTIERLLRAYPSLIRVHQQTLPYLGGAIQEAFSFVRGRFTVLMGSDLETDPHLIRSMINVMKDGKYDIVVASRWLEKQGFQGYPLLKYMCNFIFQKIFSVLYGRSLTDLTYGFRMYRTEIVQKIIWEELRHPFLLESLVKPLRLGCSVKEVPTKWVARQEGVSQNVLTSYVGYFKISLKVLFMDPNLFVKAQCLGRPKEDH